MKKIVKNKYALLATIVLLVAINWVASNFKARLDLTAEKRFTLSTSTKQFLKTLQEPVTVSVFLKGNLTSGFKQLSNATKNVLAQFKSVAGNKINFKFVNPDDKIGDVTYADTLSSLGAYPINLTSQIKDGQQQQLIYPVALIKGNAAEQLVELYKGKSPLVNFEEISSAQALLEYNLAEGIAAATQTTKPTIGYLTGNGEPEDIRTFDLVENVLQKNYTLFTIDLQKQTFIDTVFKTVILLKPTRAFTDAQKLALDQYVVNGGNLIIATDRLFAEMDSLQSQKGEVTAFDRNLELSDLLFNFGARVNADLLMDLQCDVLPFNVNGNGQYEFIPWNYFPVLQSNQQQAITKGLGYVSTQFCNTIDTVEAEGIKKTVLLSSSANARSIGGPAIISAAENVIAPQNEKFNKANLAAAVLLEGKFSSMFKNRVTASIVDSLKKYNKVFKANTDNVAKVIVVGDADILLNAVIKGNPIPMGINKFTIGTQKEFPFANKQFIQNCLSYTANAYNLSDAKAKDYVTRLLNSQKTEEEKVKWQLINIATPCAVVVIFALVFAYWRKRKYAK
jgi:ABC-2 type transport system permease protein